MQIGKAGMQWSLFAGQLISMFSIVPMVAYGTASQWVILFAMYFGIMTFGLTMGYHRYLSHGQFKCPKWFELVMLFFAHIMMVGPAILWVATHRAHHKYSDTDKDPHSPKYKGYIYAHFLQVFTEPNIKWSGRLLKDNLYRAQHRYYWEVIIVYATVLAIIDPFALVYAWLAPAGFAKLIGSLVFSYSHRGGVPHSDLIVGLITFGEGFHEEHHISPRNVVWHPLDVGGRLIQLIKLGYKQT